jgi:hypothetical protein
MENKEIYRQKKQAQLDECEAKIEKLKTEAFESESEAKHILYKQIDTAELKLKDGKEKLAAFENANKDEIEAYKKDIDDTFIAINIHLAMS